MERSEKIGLGVALAGHALLFGLLSLGFLAPPPPAVHEQPPVEVSLVPDVALKQTAPAITEPAPSVAPDEGAPEDAAPPAPSEKAPVAEPEPAPPPPAPKPEPKPAPAPPAKVPQPAPKPVPKPRPVPKRAPPAEKPAAARPAAVSKPALAKAVPAKASAPAAPAKPAPAKPAATKGGGSDATAKAARPRGSRLGPDFLKGLSDTPTKSKTVAAPAQAIGAQAAANIASAILRQVQPCANRQVTPGPGAERIRVTINLKLNADGSLAARPRIIAHDGVDEDNRRYVDRVDDLAIATFTGCSPLRGLPADLYDVPGGWSDFRLRYKLPG